MQKKKKIKPNPFEVAREAVAEAFSDKIQIGQLNVNVRDSLDHRAITKIQRAINPKIDDIENRYDKLWEKAESQGQHQLAVDFQELWSSRAIVWEDAAFVIGIAFGLQLKGETIR